jgi:hypothetical protein
VHQSHFTAALDSARPHSNQPVTDGQGKCGGAGTGSMCYVTYANQPVAVFWTPKRSPDVYVYGFVIIYGCTETMDL